MYVNLVANVMQRKVRPLHPGSIVVDILEDRGISIDNYCGSNYKLREILYGERPLSYWFAEQLEIQLGISSQLLLNLQRKVDIWDSLKKNEK